MANLFNLQDGEKIVQEIKPLSGLRWYFFVTGIGIGSVLIFPIILFLEFSSSRISRTFGSFLTDIWILAAILIPVSLAIGFVTASLRYGKQNYWITNKRIIYKRGLIGYRITSIPHERISDVIISRTLVERIFGFGSLHVQSLAGQASGGSTLGSEGVLLAVPNPEETQELIFKLVKAKRKDEGLSF